LGFSVKGKSCGAIKANISCLYMAVVSSAYNGSIEKVQCSIVVNQKKLFL